MEVAWLEALPRLRQRMGERNFATWIEPVRCARDADGWRLEVPSRFFQEWLSRHFLGAIREVLGEGEITVPSVRVVVSAHGTPAACGQPVLAPVPHKPAAPVPVAPVPAAPVHRVAQPRMPKIGHLV